MSERAMPKPATEEDILQLARDFLAGRAYTHHDVPPDLINMIFMPIFLGGLNGFTEDQLKEIVVIGVYGQDAHCGRAINGYPMFVECRLWNLADAKKAALLARRAHDSMTEEVRDE